MRRVRNRSAGASLIEVVVTLLLLSVVALFSIQYSRGNKLVLERLSSKRSEIEKRRIQRASIAEKRKAILAYGNDDRGAGLLQLLVYITLGLALVGISQASIKSTSTLERKVATAIDREEVFGIVREYIRHGILKGRVRYAIPSVIVHPIAQFNDSSGNPFRGSELPNNKQSNAISFLHLNPDWQFLILDQEKNLWCGPSSTTAAHTVREFSNWLVVYTDDYKHVRGKARDTIRHRDCHGVTYRINLEDIPQTMFADLPMVGKMAAVIPIEDSFSLYIDEQGTMRRISHTTREHQAIVSSIDSLRLALVEQQQLQILQGEIDILDKTFSFQIPVGFKKELDILDAII